MTRQYGIELEHFGLNERTEREILQRNNLNDWNLHYDGSVNGEALELVSPILPYATGRNAADIKTRTAVNAIRDAGGQVDYSCGLHIHHDVTELQSMDIYHVLRGYAWFQRAIDSILPASRRTVTENNRTEYCAPLSLDDLQQTQLIATREPRLIDFAQVCKYWDRYRTINVCSLAKYGTLEFRQHSGTLNSSKILHWKRLTRAFIQNRNMFADMSRFEGQDSTDIDVLMRILELPQSTREFYRERRDNFNVWHLDSEDAQQMDMESEDDWYDGGCDCGECYDCTPECPECSFAWHYYGCEMGSCNYSEDQDEED